MTRGEWYRIFLFVHILSAIVGLGPTFVYGSIVGMGRNEEPHARFATGVVHRLAMRMAIPLSAMIFLTGLGMIWALDRNPFQTTWLLVAMGLFIFGFTYSATVQNRQRREILMIAGGEDFDPSHPPPRFAVLGRRISWGGRYLRASATVILYLMIFKGLYPV